MEIQLIFIYSYVDTTKKCHFTLYTLLPMTTTQNKTVKQTSLNLSWECLFVLAVHF